MTAEEVAAFHMIDQSDPLHKETIKVCVKDYQERDHAQWGLLDVKLWYQPARTLSAAAAQSTK